MIVAGISKVNEAVWTKIEDHLVPLPEGTNDSRVWHYLPLTGLLPVGLCTLVVDLASRTVVYALTWFSPGYWFGWVEGDPEKDFSCVLKDSRNWEKLGELSDKITLGQDNPNFQWGVATCTLQDSPVECENSQWRDWDAQNGNCIEQNRARFENSSLIRLYKTPEGRAQLVDRLQKLGLNSYRFSLAWSEIEPEEGVYNEEMIQMWVDLCAHLRDNGIAPMVSLHHFSEPKWFHAKGSFEKEENIEHFKRFTQRVGPSLTQDYNGKPLVEHICSINEADTEGFSRYVRAAFSPGSWFDFAKGGQFMKTMMKAHNVAYKVLKETNPEVQVGFVHQIIDFQAANVLLKPVTRILNRFINEMVMNYFKTGNFELKIPFFCNIQEKGEKPKTDFIGLQYYVRPLAAFTGSTSYHEPMTNMPFREDPEGLYKAIIDAHEAFEAPVIVTENGISTKDPVQRNRYNQRALYAVQRAQEKIGKESLLGYYSWCFTDNFEWDIGLEQHFGAYPVDEAGNLSSEPKPGMETFRNVTAAWHRVHQMEEQVL